MKVLRIEDELRLRGLDPLDQKAGQGGRPEFGNFLEIVQSGSAGASALLGHRAEDSGWTQGDGYLEIDGLASAKGGVRGKPPKDDPPPDPDPDPEPPPDLPLATGDYTSGAADDATTDYFNIALNFNGDGWTDELIGIFEAAADYFSAVIGEGVVATAYQGLLYDDIVIDATIEAIDGAGGILGQAGAVVVRDTGDTTADPGEAYLPILAIMEFDSADVNTFLANGTFGDIVWHEMMHCLGFAGTIFDLKGLFGELVDDRDTKRPIDDVIDYRFLGDTAETEYAADFPLIWADDSIQNGVPLETTGGSGTARSHWDEDLFGNELMTGYINPDNYISDMSVAALDDLGYTLSATAYDEDYLV